MAKYFWLKLHTSFFDSDEIRIVEKMENGPNYILFWMKLLLKAITQTEPGVLRFRENIPFTPDLLATTTGTDIDIVRSALKVFRELGMLRVLENGDIWVEGAQAMIGSETKWAEYKRVERQQVKLLDNVQTESKKCPVELELEKEIEIDKEIAAKDAAYLPLAEELAAAVITTLPRQQCNPSAWARDIRLLIEKDGASAEEVKRVLAWLPGAPTNGNFCWAGVVLSGAKLRKHFPRLLPEASKNGKGEDPEMARLHREAMKTQRRYANVS